MRIETIETDVLLFRGDAYEGVATAFIEGGNVLLVDALASRPDAMWMREEIENRLGKKVRVIVVTHYMSDHIAGLSLFPEAQIVAHQHFLHTFMSQRDRSVEDERDFIPPTQTISDTLTLRWGRHTLEIFHNPGKTLCTLCVDVPDCGLVFASDNIVGNIAYLSSSVPELIDASIERLERRGRARVIGGHMGALPAAALGNAREYLRRLRERVLLARDRPDPDKEIEAISVEDCLAAGVEPTEFEREWHAHNLGLVKERGFFRGSIVVHKETAPCATLSL